MAAKPIPDGYHSVTPYLTVQGADRLLDLTVQGADRLLDFMKKAFAAKETVRLLRNDGSISHAEVRIGDSVVMVGEASEQSSASQGMIHLYVEDCDATYEQAMREGAGSLREPTDQFYGDRMAGVRDPTGNQWWIATHVEDVPDEEMARRASQLATSGAPQPS